MLTAPWGSPVKTWRPPRIFLKLSVQSSCSKHRFPAAVGATNCIAVLVSNTCGLAFGAHINQASLHSSLNVLEGGDMILDNMSKAMQRVFRNVDPSVQRDW